MPGEKKPEEKIKAGKRLHLKVPPQVALMLFQDVAPKNDWKVLSAGDQKDINGEVKGKFFRVETIKFVGGRRVMSGVFFKEDDDEEKSYVTMGKPSTDVEYGIPLALVKPMQAAVAEWAGERDERDELDELDDEESPLEEALSGDQWAGERDERDELDELDDEESPLEEALSGDL